jgi:peptidoglycan/xylan/chitin deacetylase (PgdA/CDA1 family)
MASHFATLTFTILCWLVVMTEAVEKPVVVFRLDDVQPWWCEKQSIATIDAFLAQNAAINVGIIGKQLDQSSNLVNYLNAIATNPLVEMVSHSFSHQTFRGQSLTWQKNELTSANSMINTVTGKTATTFIPPFNQYSDDVFDALKQTGFNVMSGECAWYPAGSPNEGTPIYCPDGSDVVAPDIMVNGVYSLPTGAVMGGMAYWNDYHQPADYNVAMGWINAQIGKNHQHFIHKCNSSMIIASCHVLQQTRVSLL